MRKRVSFTNIRARTLGCFALCIRLGLVVYRRIAQSIEQEIAAGVQRLQNSLRRPNVFRPELIDQPVKRVPISSSAHE